MNRLTARLWHACFEQRPFAQEDLIQACLALPKLARFWLGTNERASGYARGLVRHGEYRNVRILGRLQPHGLAWDFIEFFQPGGEINRMLRIWIRDQGNILLYLGQTCPKGTPPENRDLLVLSSWIQREAQSCKILGYVRVNSRFQCFNFDKLSDLLFSPESPGCLSDLKGPLARAVQVYKDTTPENLPVFQALARHSHE